MWESTSRQHKTKCNWQVICVNRLLLTGLLHSQIFACPLCVCCVPMWAVLVLVAMRRDVWAAHRSRWVSQDSLVDSGSCLILPQIPGIVFVSSLRAVLFGYILPTLR